MLPSKEIAALSKEVTLVLVRKTDPGCAELREEFSVPYLNSWVVVLDGKGETLASWIGDVAGAGCKQSAVAQFPKKMAEWIRKCLRITESLQELERRWKNDIRNMEKFDNYARRLGGMHAFKRLQEICRQQAVDARLGQKDRSEFRVREFLARGAENGPELSSRRGRAHFAREGEKLLVELADHPRSADLPNALFGSVYAHVFDVPARSAEAIARLEDAASKLVNPSGLRKRLRQLCQIRNEWIKEMKEFLQKADNPTNKQFIAASLGDAQAAIELFSQPGYKDIADYQDRLRDAKRKLKQENKRRDG